MSESPLLKRARSRLEQERVEARDRWEVKPAAFRSAMIRWGIRILLITAILVLALYRFGGGRIF